MSRFGCVKVSSKDQNIEGQKELLCNDPINLYLISRVETVKYFAYKILLI